MIPRICPVSMIVKNTGENLHMYNSQPVPAFKTKILIAKIYARKRKKFKQKLGEIQQDLTKL